MATYMLSDNVSDKISSILFFECYFEYFYIKTLDNFSWENFHLEKALIELKSSVGTDHIRKNMSTLNFERRH